MTERVQPQAVEIEKAILGAILLEKEAINTAIELLKPEMFYNTANQYVFSAYLDLYSKSEPIDHLTVSDHIKAKNQVEKIGGMYYLTQLTNTVVSSAHLTKHCQKVVEKYVLRELIKIGGNLYTKAFDESADPFELTEEVEKIIHNLTLTSNTKDYLKIDDTLIDILKDLEEKRNREEFLTGVTTGFRELDRHTCGWQPSDLMILAARPKCGKTAMALAFAMNAALSGNGVGFFSMEMSSRQLVKRLLANKANMPLQALRDARLSDAEMVQLFENGVKKICGLDFYIDDTAALTVAEFKAKARRMIKKDNVKFLVVDYLQLFQPANTKKSQTREQEISTIARQLKIAAKELNVPLLALSQLSREIEKRASNVPVLSDLRESGAIEQDADMVMFLYKPTDAEIMDDRTKENQINLKIAAYRNGDLKSFEFDFQGMYQRFEERGLLMPQKQLTPITNSYGFPGKQSSFNNNEDLF